MRDDSDDEAFLVKKENARDIETIPSNPWKVSKRQMHKIKVDGPYGGRNIKLIEDSDDDDVIKPIKGKLFIVFKPN